MDPDENLKEQRRLTKAILDASDDPSGALRYALWEHGEELARHVQALDEWLTKAGHLPGAWGKHWRGVRSSS